MKIWYSTLFCALWTQNKKKSNLQRSFFQSLIVWKICPTCHWHVINILLCQYSHQHANSWYFQLWLVYIVWNELITCTVVVKSNYFSLITKIRIIHLISITKKILVKVPLFTPCSKIGLIYLGCLCIKMNWHYGNRLVERTMRCRGELASPEVA